MAQVWICLLILTLLNIMSQRSHSLNSAFLRLIGKIVTVHVTWKENVTKQRQSSGSTQRSENGVVVSANELRPQQTPRDPMTKISASV